METLKALLCCSLIFFPPDFNDFQKHQNYSSIILCSKIMQGLPLVYILYTSTCVSIIWMILIAQLALENPRDQPCKLLGCSYLTFRSRFCFTCQCTKLKFQIHLWIVPVIIVYITHILRSAFSKYTWFNFFLGIFQGFRLSH